MDEWIWEFIRRSRPTSNSHSSYMYRIQYSRAVLCTLYYSTVTTSTTRASFSGTWTRINWVRVRTYHARTQSSDQELFLLRVKSVPYKCMITTLRWTFLLYRRIIDCVVFCSNTHVLEVRNIIPDWVLLVVTVEYPRYSSNLHRTLRTSSSTCTCTYMY